MNRSLLLRLIRNGRNFCRVPHSTGRFLPRQRMPVCRKDFSHEEENKNEDIFETPQRKMKRSHNYDVSSREIVAGSASASVSNQDEFEQCDSTAQSREVSKWVCIREHQYIWSRNDVQHISRGNEPNPQPQLTTGRLLLMSGVTVQRCASACSHMRKFVNSKPKY